VGISERVRLTTFAPVVHRGLAKADITGCSPQL
jgi:hypothetical protein